MRKDRTGKSRVPAGGTARNFSGAAVVFLLAANLFFYRSALVNAFFGNDLLVHFHAVDMKEYLDAFGLEVNTAARSDLKTYYYRPFNLLTMRVAHDLFGNDFRWLHAVVLGTHLVNVILVFYVMRRFLGAVFVPAAGALLWSLGFYKADAVMWMCAPHVFYSFLLLLGLAAGGRISGVAGGLVRAGLLALAVLFSETPWSAAPFLLLEVAWLRKTCARESWTYGAGIAALAAGFYLLYRQIAADSIYPSSEFHVPEILRATLPLVTSLFIPFHLMLNQLNLKLAPILGFAIGWPHVLIPFWAIFALAAWAVFRSAPRLWPDIRNDRVIWWGLAWTGFSLLLNAQSDTWLHGRHIYLSSVGFALAIMRVIVHLSRAFPRRALAVPLSAFLVILVLQVYFSHKTVAHMDRGHREIPSMVADLRAKEPPPVAGETWVVTNYSWGVAELRAYIRFAYGKAPKLVVYRRKAEKLPPMPYRILEYDHTVVKLNRVR